MSIKPFEYSRCQFVVEVKGLKFTVILREEPEGGYSAQVVELPGCISQGETREETLKNIRGSHRRLPGGFSGRNKPA
jgi:hypothetical protein